jgi:hypothetical protein
MLLRLVGYESGRQYVVAGARFGSFVRRGAGSSTSRINRLPKGAHREIGNRFGNKTL